MEDVLMEYDYMRYLEATMDEQFDLEQYVLESVGVAFNESQRLEVFTEGVGEKIKNAWAKFVAWIKKVWNKFLERLAKTFSNAKGYLEQYKDIILKKKVKEGYTVEVPNYRTGIDRIFRTSVDVIQPGDIQNVFDALRAASDRTKISDGNDPRSAETRVNDGIKEAINKIPAWKKLRDTFTSGDTVANVDNVNFDQDNETIRSTMKQYFLGGQVKTYKTDDSTVFNMSDMYEFCYNYEKIVANIEKDKDNFFKTSTNISNTIEAEAKKVTNSNETKAKTAAEVKPENNKQGDNLFQTKKENEGPKPVGGEAASILLSELQINNTGAEKSNTTTPASSSGEARTSALDASKNNIGKDADNTDNYTKTGAKIGGEVDVQTSSIENATKYVDLIVKILNKYRDECVDTLTAEMNAANQISKDYMDLIVAHVRGYVGTPDNVGDNKPVQNKTDYKGTQPNNQNKK